GPAGGRTGGHRLAPSVGHPGPHGGGAGRYRAGHRVGGRGAPLDELDKPAVQPGPSAHAGSVSLGTIAAQWGRIGIIGFGGPPAHIALLRRLCVTDRGWLADAEFEDAIATT